MFCKCVIATFKPWSAPLHAQAAQLDIFYEIPFSSSNPVGNTNTVNSN